MSASFNHADGLACYPDLLGEVCLRQSECGARCLHSDVRCCLASHVSNIADKCRVWVTWGWVFVAVWFGDAYRIHFGGSK